MNFEQVRRSRDSRESDTMLNTLIAQDRDRVAVRYTDHHPTVSANGRCMWQLVRPQPIHDVPQLEMLTLTLLHHPAKATPDHRPEGR